MSGEREKPTKRIPDGRCGNCGKACFGKRGQPLLWCSDRCRNAFKDSAAAGSGILNEDVRALIVEIRMSVKRVNAMVERSRRLRLGLPLEEPDDVPKPDGWTGYVSPGFWD